MSEHEVKVLDKTLKQELAPEIKEFLEQLKKVSEMTKRDIK
jgi:hypothetical protein